MVVLACVLVLPLGSCSPARTGEALNVLRDIEAGAGPSDLKDSTPEPDRRAITFSVEGRERRGDLYDPNQPVAAGMVIVPGAAEAGKDDPRLVAFANTFARARFEVLVPDVEAMRELRVTSDDARVLADAIIHLHERDPDRPLGLAAISFALGPGVLALFEPGAGDRVDVVVGVGGYFDVVETITFFTTGHYRESADAPWQHRTPNEYGKWVFALSNANRLDDPDDAQVLTEMAEWKMRYLEADVSNLAARLGPQGQAVYDLLTNDDPDRVPALIAALPESIQEEIEALDLSRKPLETLAAEFILIHGREDPIIPATESMAFARALPEDQVRLYVVDSIGHVEPESPGVVDSVRLLRAVYRVLSWRDSVAQ
ncbi:MAG: alpha/beta hydrolase [Rhodospirillales bacterium]|nr:MAG: alpha/beta hydrolase [Rhodospirillales bacterium]